MASHPRPLALGLLHVATGTPPAARTQARVDIALHSNRNGYALVETFEFGTSTLTDDLQLRDLEELAERLDVHALVTAGPVDHDRVAKIADRLRLVIVPCVDPGT
jgi:hypothetical protein